MTIQQLKKYLPFVLAFFHLIGLGIFIYNHKAPDLSYVTITLSALVVLLMEKKHQLTYLVFAVIFAGGYLVELIGVQTGYLFGEYSYLPSMGPTIMDTPIFIGACWYGVVVGAANIARYVKGSPLMRSLLAAILAVAMDIVLERTAIAYGLWSWINDSVPFYNYFCWFLFSFLFAWLYLRKTEEKNKLSVWLYIIWFLFFSILSIFR